MHHIKCWNFRVFRVSGRLLSSKISTADWMANYNALCLHLQLWADDGANPSHRSHLQMRRHRLDCRVTPSWEFQLPMWSDCTASPWHAHIRHSPFNNEFLLRQIISPLWNSAICHRTKCCYASSACRVLHGWNHKSCIVLNKPPAIYSLALWIAFL